MTPKEKADELFNKMDMIIYTDQDHDSQCKRCAIIAVDEIIKSWDNDLYEICGASEYWKEVRKEIEKL